MSAKIGRQFDRVFSSLNKLQEDLNKAMDMVAELQGMDDWSQAKPIQSGSPSNGSNGEKRSLAPRDMACIAPKCKSQSKGPRFHFLCERHLDSASPEEVAIWTAARKAARKAAKSS